jgi:hypothetical protein
MAEELFGIFAGKNFTDWQAVLFILSIDILIY